MALLVLICRRYATKRQCQLYVKEYIVKAWATDYPFLGKILLTPKVLLKQVGYGMHHLKSRRYLINTFVHC